MCLSVLTRCGMKRILPVNCWCTYVLLQWGCHHCSGVHALHTPGRSAVVRQKMNVPTDTTTALRMSNVRTSSTALCVTASQDILALAGLYRCICDLCYSLFKLIVSLIVSKPCFTRSVWFSAVRSIAVLISTNNIHLHASHACIVYSHVCNTVSACVCLHKLKTTHQKFTELGRLDFLVTFDLSLWIWANCDGYCYFCMYLIRK